MAPLNTRNGYREAFGPLSTISCAYNKLHRILGIYTNLVRIHMAIRPLRTAAKEVLVGN